MWVIRKINMIIFPELQNKGTGNREQIRNFSSEFKAQSKKRMFLPDDEQRKKTVSLFQSTQQRDRLGKAAEWFDLPNIQEVVVYDHHLGQDTDIPATQLYLDRVGATTTLMAEELQKRHISLNSAQATVMALGIHVDTGSLTYDQSTPRDALALAWLTFSLFPLNCQKLSPCCSLMISL